MAEIFHDGAGPADAENDEQKFEIVEEGADEAPGETPPADPPPAEPVPGGTTPPEPAPTPAADELPADFDENVDPTEEELAAMPEGMRKRAQNLLRKRRSAERKMSKAFAERDEAVRVAQAAREQLAQMRDMIKTGEQQYIQTAKSAAEIAAAHAQAELRDAYSAGDADRIAAAQRKLTAAQLYANQAQSYKPVAPDVEARVAQLLATPTPTVTAEDVVPVEDNDNVHPDTKRWFAKNSSWFNSDQRMRTYALSLGAELEAQGVDPRTDAKTYFGEIDKEMRLRFPEKFAAAAPAPTPARQTTSPVAGAQPSSSAAPKRVVLPKGARAIAERLGISIEDYAREYIARNGS